VKPLTNLALAALMLVALCSAPLTTAKAQTLKPVAVVSVASIKENLADIAYVTRTAGMPDYGDTAKFFAGALTAGIDKERPIGMYVVPQGGEFHGIAFIPLEPNGLQTILKVHKEQLGEPKDAGNGILEIGNTKTVFVKEQGGWAFVAEGKEYLTGLPQDPMALLGNLPKKFNVAGKLMVQNIPDELRRMAIDEMKLGMERFLDSPAARQGNVDRDQARLLTKAYLDKIEKLINESDELSLGIGVDETAKRALLEIGFSAKDATSLAKTMALQADAKTNFAGFALPEASVTFSMVSKASPEDIQQVGPTLKAARDQWAKQIDDSPDIPGDKREAIKAALSQVVDILQKSIETGTLDGGGALVLLPKSVSFVGGGSVASGADVEKLLKTIADLGKDIPNFPQLKLNSGSLGDMKLSRLTAPIPEAQNDARELLGDNLEIIVAIGPKSVIVAGGKEADALLKKVVDQSAQERNKTVSPLELKISLLPILKFYKSVDDNPIVNQLLGTLERSGNDRVMLTNEAAPRSSTTRLEIQEGVIKAIGEGIKGALAQMNRG
jgi:hypothetical protein